MDNKYQAICDLMEKEVDEGRLFGNALTIGNRNGEIFSTQYGEIKGDTLCRLFSMAKSFACVAAWILIERGQLDPDKKVTDYLPFFDHLMIMDENGTRPASTEITIRHLLTMTTGIPYTSVAVKIFSGPSDEMLKMIRGVLGRFRDGENITSLDVLRALAENPIEFEPGTRYRYGMNCEILGYIMETITGKRLHEFYKEEILDPLGLEHTGFRYNPGDQIARMSEIDENGKLREKLVSDMYPCDYPDGRCFGDSAGGGWFFEVTYGGMYSTRDDIATFTRMLLNGGELNGHRILKEETVKNFSKNTLPEELLDSYIPGGHYGHNTFLKVTLDDTQIEKAGSFSGAGYMGSYYIVDPKSDLYIVYMQQCTEYPDIFERLEKLIYQTL